MPAACLCWAAVGWAVARPGHEVLAIAGGGGLLAASLAALLAATVHRQRRRQRHCGTAEGRSLLAGATVTCCAVVVVLASTGLQARERGAAPVAGWVQAGASAVLEVTVVGDPRPVRSRRPGAAPRSVVDATASAVRARGQRVEADLPVLLLGDTARVDALRPGERWRVVGALVATEPGDEVVALVRMLSAPERLSQAGTVHRAAEQLREGLRAATAGLGADAAGLLPSLVAGDTSRLPPDLQEAMRTTGLTHLTAVSGGNVTIVVGAVLLLGAACGLPRPARAVLAFLGLAGFVVLARPEPSVLRASVMGAVALSGVLAGRRGAGLPALAASVVVLLAIDPWLSRAYGFALSALATAALLVLVRPWAGWLQDVVPRCPRWLALAVAVPAAAQAVCGPVVVLLAPQLAALAVPANLLVTPVVAPATVLGVLALLLATVWPAGAAGVAWVGGTTVGWVAVVARTGAAMPGAAWPWPAGPGGAALLAGCTVLLVACCAVATRRRPGVLGPRLPGRPRLRRIALRRSVLTAVVASLVAVLAVTWPGLALVRPPWSGPTWPPPDWWAVMCDVGQGDMLVVATGRGRALVVDAGPDAERARTCLDDLDVRTVDALVLTHFHADHVDGLEGVLDGREVTLAVTSPLAQPEAAAERVGGELTAAGVVVRVAGVGDRGRAGAATWEVLWPPPGALGGRSEADGESSSAANDASVVLVLDVAGTRLLATGDLEPDAQAALLVRVLALPGGPSADVLKVAHHGSAYQHAGLLAAVRPRLALIGVGADNDYGHPAPGTLVDLGAAGAVVARTDIDGDVAVVGHGGEMVAVTRRTRGRRWALAGCRACHPAAAPAPPRSTRWTPWTLCAGGSRRGSLPWSWSSDRRRSWPTARGLWW